MAIRCFVAVNLPPELKGRLAELEAQLKEARADVNWVKPESIHLTLKFLGEVEEERIPQIKRAIQEGSEGAGPLMLSLAGMGAFPHLRSPRVIWVGVGGEQERLCELQERLERAMERIGFPREGRPFSPHITLGRMRSGRGSPALMDLVSRKADLKVGTVRAESIELMQSRLHPAGASYSVIESFPLMAPSGGS
ncbi:MAG: RNA 2',3'-cyclic phosphodiesterase [candidate division NC10 bacterium]|nr:RNA 2',3'-cyclic phosphodiesterase [candidate division NC10 bacterium]